MIARDSIELLVAPSEVIGRVRECAEEHCTSLFLDTSRSDVRRWYSVVPCGNRLKVQAYRARQRSSAP